jgi:hypothetical protein
MEFRFSARVAIARYAHTGRWIAKRLPPAVVEAGKTERAKHKRGERCLGCEMQTLDITWIPGTYEYRLTQIIYGLD